MNRRGFLTGMAGAVASSPALAASGKSAGKPAVTETVMPPGAPSVEHLLSHCTSCGLCVAKCPSKVIRPAGLEYGIGGMMMPRLSFAHGFCDYHCHVCSHVCPAGALLPLAHDIKLHTRIGKAVYTMGDCVVEKDKVHCGICAEHCPTKAISMHKNANGREYPEVDEAKCIGCGTCEYFCPGKPKAMKVMGFSKQDISLGSTTLLAVLPDGRVWSSEARGLQPLLGALAEKMDLKGAVCYDRMVGRAAAFLFIRAQVAKVCAPVVAKGAVELLTRHGIACEAGQLVEVIRNRDNTDMCPMEKAVLPIADDPQSAEKALRAQCEKWANEKAKAVKK